MSATHVLALAASGGAVDTSPLSKWERLKAAPFKDIFKLMRKLYFYGLVLGLTVLAVFVPLLVMFREMAASTSLEGLPVGEEVTMNEGVHKIYEGPWTAVFRFLVSQALFVPPAITTICAAVAAYEARWSLVKRILIFAVLYMQVIGVLEFFVGLSATVSAGMALSFSAVSVYASTRAINQHLSELLPWLEVPEIHWKGIKAAGRRSIASAIVWSVAVVLGYMYVLPSVYISLDTVGRAAFRLIGHPLILIIWVMVTRALLLVTPGCVQRSKFSPLTPGLAALSTFGRLLIVTTGGSASTLLLSLLVSVIEIGMRLSEGSQGAFIRKFLKTDKYKGIMDQEGRPMPLGPVSKYTASMSSLGRANSFSNIGQKKKRDPLGLEGRDENGSEILEGVPHFATGVSGVMGRKASAVDEDNTFNVDPVAMCKDADGTWAPAPRSVDMEELEGLSGAFARISGLPNIVEAAAPSSSSPQTPRTRAGVGSEDLLVGAGITKAADSGAAGHGTPIGEVPGGRRGSNVGLLEADAASAAEDIASGRFLKIPVGKKPISEAEKRLSRSSPAARRPSGVDEIRTRESQNRRYSYTKNAMVNDEGTQVGAARFYSVHRNVFSEEYENLMSDHGILYEMMLEITGILVAGVLSYVLFHGHDPTITGILVMCGNLLGQIILEVGVDCFVLCWVLQIHNRDIIASWKNQADNGVKRLIFFCYSFIAYALYNVINRLMCITKIGDGGPSDIVFAFCS